MSKRKALTIEKKAAIIWRLEAGETNMSVAKELNMSHSTISTIWKNRETIKKIVESSSSSMSTKKLRSCSQSRVDEALLQWFKVQSNHNVVLSGPILQAKANDFARKFALDDFKCSAGWIQRFRKRHNIICGKTSGKAADVTEDWLSTVWPNLRKGYTDEQIFNAEETGLLFRLMPEETMKFKGEKCIGGALSKERFTILVAANMTGSAKFKLVVIGKSKHPRCLDNIKYLPVEYESNSKGWMTSDLFEKIIRKWDSIIFNQENKIILLLDNSQAHPNMDHLKAIKLVILPPYVLQPMDQGVIKSLKTQYRKLQIMKLLKEMDIADTTPRKINILESILMISQAWDRVSQRTISNCFTQAGFKSQAAKECYEELQKNSSDIEEDLSLAEWARTLNVKNLTTDDNWENFTNVDEDLETGNSNMIEEEILTKVTEEDADAETKDSDVEVCEFTPPSLTDAFSAVQTIRNYFALNQELKEVKIESAISHLEIVIETKFIENKQITRPDKLTDFFDKIE